MDWLHYHDIEPWGEIMADARNGELCALTANCNRDAAKKPEPFTRADFMLLAEPEPEPVKKILTVDETEDHLKAIFGV